MNRPLKTVLIGAVLASLASVSAFAQAETAARPEDPAARPRAVVKGEATRAAVTPKIAADAPFARVAALVRPNLVLARNKGVASVRRIDRGVYCIRPNAASGVDPATAVVTVTPEYFFSLYNEVTVQWASRQNGCATNEIGVYTFADDNLNGIYSFSNAVGFSIIVP